MIESLLSQAAEPRHTRGARQVQAGQQRRQHRQRPRRRAQQGKLLTFAVLKMRPLRAYREVYVCVRLRARVVCVCVCVCVCVRVKLSLTA